MSKVEVWNIEGKKIIYVEFSGLPKEEIQAIEIAKKEIAKSKPKSALIITDVTRANYDSEAVDALKGYTKHNTPYVKYSAVVGVTGMKKVILWSIQKLTGREFKLFNTIDQAKEWIVKQKT